MRRTTTIEKAYDTPEDLLDDINSYFDNCDSVEENYTFEGLALALSLSSPNAFLGCGNPDNSAWEVVKEYARTRIRHQRKLKMFRDEINIKTAERDLDEFAPKGTPTTASRIIVEFEGLDNEDESTSGV